mmetsp:Transcript_4852/g.16916  ORF Transcript_4852/g.16916 Transcript_4852/m.16916 type:complete len:101 (-) Transcript_4852:874-1176(-)
MSGCSHALTRGLRLLRGGRRLHLQFVQHPVDEGDVGELNARMDQQPVAELPPTATVELIRPYCPERDDERDDEEPHGWRGDRAGHPPQPLPRGDPQQSPP